MPRTLIPAVAVLAALAGIQPVGASNPWAKLHRPLHLPRLAPGSACPVSRVDPRFDWQRFQIVGGSGIGRGPVYPGLGDSAGRLYTQADDQKRAALGPGGSSSVCPAELPGTRIDPRQTAGRPSVPRVQRRPAARPGAANPSVRNRSVDGPTGGEPWRPFGRARALIRVLRRADRRHHFQSNRGLYDHGPVASAADEHSWID